MYLQTLVACILFVTIISVAGEIDNKYLQCLVCRSTMEEMENVLSKIDPKKMTDTGNFRLDAKGNMLQKKVPLARSEVYLSEVLGNICTKMDDYVRATYKSNGKLMIFNLISPEGGMSSEMSKVDIIQDGDLNKSLKYLCDEIVEEHEEPIISIFGKGGHDVINKVCTEASNLCSDSIPSDDDNDFSDRTEL